MNSLTKNSIHTVTIDGYSSDGSGIARIDGMVVFVKGAIKGETCEIKILKVYKTASYAKIERIIAPSPHRAEPICPIFGKCGGCDLMHMDYEEELEFKKSRVQDALERIGGLDIKLSGIIGAKSRRDYRNKAIYAVGADKSGKPVSGFFRERSHDIVSTDRCFIQADVSDRASAAVCRWMEKYNVRPYDEKKRMGLIRHVFCRCGFVSGQAQVTIVAFKKDIPHVRALIDEILYSCPEAVGIVLNVNNSTGNTVLSGTFHTLWGSPFLEDTLCSLKFELSPQAFYQINHDQAEVLYATALDFASLTGNETVLDLYCGTGTITLCLAKGAKRVIGAEIIEDAIINARKNAERNGIKNAEFICADASKAAKELKNSALHPDVIVVDPPRKGLKPDVIETISEMNPHRVVYVSCDSATLARDLKIFSALGYETKKAVAVDMFPCCAHVESVVLLSRA